MRTAFVLASTIALVVACAPSPQATAIPSSAPIPTAAPTGTPVAARGKPFQVWTRIELPDPEPDAYGGGTPASVTAFNGGYVAAGSLTSCCDGLHLSEARGVLWTSRDGRTWTLQDHLLVFDHADIRGIVTVGDRLVVAGVVAASPTNNEETKPAVWVSTDGVTWNRTVELGLGELPSPGSWAIGDTLVTAGAEGDEQPVVVLVSTDGGATWSRVPEQEALPRDAELAQVIEVPGGLLAVGWIWGGVSPHRLPEAWVSSR